MIPEVGTTCLFSFRAKFSTLDGVYRIRAETTFLDAIASKIDFVAHLYTQAGLSQTDFNNDYSGYLKDRIVVLESVVSSSIVIYVPESIFQKVPDPTIKEFVPLMLTVNLGVYENAQVIYPLLDHISDLIKASLGVTDPLRILTNTQNKVYLTNTQYEALEQARLTNIHTLVPLSLQLKQEQDKNTLLAAKVAAYEDLIKRSAL